MGLWFSRLIVTTGTGSVIAMALSLGVEGNQHKDASGESLQEKANQEVPAMMNDAVIRHVFSFLPVIDLKACRLVHSNWAKRAAPYLAKKSKPITLARGLPVRELISCASACQAVPFQQITVYMDIWYAMFMELCHSMQDWVTELTVMYRWQQVAFREQEQTPVMFPALKVLCIELDRGVDNEGYLKSAANFVCLLIDGAPVLKALVMREDYHIGTFLINGIDLIVQSLGQTSQQKRARVSTLKLHCAIQPEHFEQLMALELHLFCLSLQLPHCNRLENSDKDDDLVEESPPFDYGSLKLFLKSQSETLTSLDITGFGNWITVSFPRLRRLQFLSLAQAQIGCGWTSNRQKFPALRRLHFDERGEGNWGILFFEYGHPTLEPFQNCGDSLDFVEELVVYQYWPVERIEVIVRLFPNLRKFTIGCSEELLEVIGNRLGRLEELTLFSYPQNPIDCALMGVTSEEYEQIEELAQRDFEMAAEKYTATIRGSSAFACLQTLKTLRLRSETLSDTFFDETMFEECDCRVISELTCRLVLMNLDMLKCLDFCGRNPVKPFEISADVLQGMREKFLVLI